MHEVPPGVLVDPPSPRASPPEALGHWFWGTLVFVVRNEFLCKTKLSVGSECAGSLGFGAHSTSPSALALSISEVRFPPTVRALSSPLAATGQGTAHGSVVVNVIPNVRRTWAAATLQAHFRTRSQGTLMSDYRGMPGGFQKPLPSSRQGPGRKHGPEGAMTPLPPG